MRDVKLKYYNSHQVYLQVEQNVKEIVNKNGYGEDMADVILNLYDYIMEKTWYGACHASTAVLYVALKEMGYNVALKIGECQHKSDKPFDHSWIELDDKIIDLAIFLPFTQNVGMYGGPVVCGLDVISLKPSEVTYGVNTGLPFFGETEMAINTTLSDYMDRFPNELNGLWTVLEKVYPYDGELVISDLRNKYKTIKRELVR